MEDINSRFEDDDIVYINNNQPEDPVQETDTELNSIAENLKDEISAHEHDGNGHKQNEMTEQDYTELLNSLESMQTAFKGDMEDEVKSILAEEIKKAKQELVAENRKAIAQIVEHQKSLIKEMVGAEKKAIWENVDRLKESLAKKYSDELGFTNK